MLFITLSFGCFITFLINVIQSRDFIRSINKISGLFVERQYGFISEKFTIICNLWRTNEVYRPGLTPGLWSMKLCSSYGTKTFIALKQSDIKAGNILGDDATTTFSKPLGILTICLQILCYDASKNEKKMHCILFEITEPQRYRNGTRTTGGWGCVLKHNVFWDRLSSFLSEAL